MIIQIKDGQREVRVESVLETEKDGRGGCIFRDVISGKTFFAAFHHFSFVFPATIN